MDLSNMPSDTVIPPLRFAIVEPYLYRGSYPRPLNFPFLESLKLKTVISLTPEPPAENVAAWAESQGIRHIHIRPEKTAKKSAPIRPDQAKDVLEIILDQKNAPVYVHCLNGSEITSTAICALRKLQFWTHPTIYSEMLRFSDMHSSTEHFVETFASGDSEVVITIPEERVHWLWQGLADEEGLLPISAASREIAPTIVKLQYEDEHLEKKRRAREEGARYLAESSQRSREHSSAAAANQTKPTT
ncbi:MAG: hypothetical protein M1819_006642 [Sarea resinae]|nr:MAG: hypothetical protein M1819_006642 [Sarea resinae]